MNTNDGYPSTTSADIVSNTSLEKQGGDLSSSVSVPLLHEKTLPRTNSSTASIQHSWGKRFAWQRLGIVLGLLLLASVLSIAHHLYYSYLDTQRAGSTDRQQWSIRIGTSFVTTFVILLRAAVGIAYAQLLWLALRKRAFSVSDIDALFTLGSGDGTVLFKKGIWTTTTATVVPVAMLIMLLPTAAIFPPATLSVTLQQYNSTNQFNVPQVNWTKYDETCSRLDDGDCVYELIHKIAIQVFQDGEVHHLYEPAANSSYRLSFEGPSLSCEAPNATQQTVFDFYVNRSNIEHGFKEITADISNGDPGYYLLYWSSFIPPNIMSNESRSNPELGAAYWNTTQDSAFSDMAKPRYDVKDIQSNQLWIQIFGQRLVCTLMIADFDISIVSVQGSQTLIYNNIEPKRTLRVPPFAGDRNITRTELLAEISQEIVFNELASALEGNISFFIDDFTQPFEETSSVLLSNLAACPELDWTSILYSFNNITHLWGVPSQEFTKAAGWFPPHPSDCRNQSLARAVEDSMNNITVSMLSSSYFTHDMPTVVNVSGNQIVYVYSPRELILSYAIALGLSFFAVAGGLLAAWFNGIIHVSTFSAFIATTRNPELNRLFAKENTAAYPLSKDVGEQKLRLGNLPLSPSKGNTANPPGEAHETEGRMAFATAIQLEKINE